MGIPLKKRRKDNILILLYKGLKGKARIPTDDLIPKTRRGRNSVSPIPQKGHGKVLKKRALLGRGDLVRGHF